MNDTIGCDADKLQRAFTVQQVRESDNADILQARSPKSVHHENNVLKWIRFVSITP